MISRKCKDIKKEKEKDFYRYKNMEHLIINYCMTCIGCVYIFDTLLKTLTVEYLYNINTNDILFILNSNNLFGDTNLSLKCSLNCL